MATSDIILGSGIVIINSLIGLTRGGSQFVVEREYRVIEADGDYGPVMGRIRKTKSVAKMTINALELNPTLLKKLLPATNIGTNSANQDFFEPALDVTNSDYYQIQFVGKTLGGSDVIITLNNAINLENFDLSMVDKEEVVASITFTAAYYEADRTIEPWRMTFID